MKSSPHSNLRRLWPPGRPRPAKTRRVYLIELSDSGAYGDCICFTKNQARAVIRQRRLDYPLGLWSQARIVEYVPVKRKARTP